ncbi:MAG TPA: hypothetical protein VIM29_05550 [Bacillota bacterium]
MRCSGKKDNGERLVEKSETAQLDPILQEHLAECAAGREQLQVSDCIRLLGQMPRVTPDAAFSAAWKKRLHQEAARQASPLTLTAFLNRVSWRPVLGTAMLVAVSLAGYAMFYSKPVAPLKKTVTGQVLGRTAATEVVLYELKIVEFGPKSKEVQKLIRNYRSSHEGGVALMLRQQREDWSVLSGLTLAEVKKLQRKLEAIGAKVEVVANCD